MASVPAPPSDLGRTSGATVLGGGLWSVLGRVVPQLQLLALSVVAARFLGPQDMGRQSYLAFVALTVVFVATAGLPASVSRFVAELLGARRGGIALTLYRGTWRLEAVAAALAGTGLAVAGALGGDLVLAWCLVAVVATLSVLQSVPQALLAGAQRWRAATVPGLVTGLVALPAAIAVLAAGGGIPGLFAVEAGAAAVTLAWTARRARDLAAELPAAAPVPPALRRRYVAFAAVATATVLVQYVVWSRSELFVLERVSPAAELAYYSIAFATVAGLTRITEAVARVTMPAVATLAGAAEQDRIRSGLWRAARLLVVVTPAAVAGAAVTGPALLRLAYGEDFAPAGDVLLVLLGPLLVLPLLALSRALLFALGRVRFLLMVGIVATLVDVGLALALIPALDAVGAACANAAAQLTAGVPCLVLAARLHGPVALDRRCVLGGLGLAVAAGGGALLGRLALGDGSGGALAGVAAGAALVVIAARLLRPLASEDAAWLSAALGRTRRGRTLAAAIRRLAPA